MVVKEQEEKDTDASEGAPAFLLQVIFLSAGDGRPLQGHTISQLCLSFPSSLTPSSLFRHLSPNLSFVAPIFQF